MKNPFDWRFVTPLLLGSTLNPINSSMIATGLVGIAADFHTGPGATATLVSVLYLCSAIAQPTMGKLSTVFGPRRVFLTGIVILALGGTLGALAPGFGLLLVSRALIGIGTSACYPTAMALVRKRADDAGVGIPSRVLGNFSIAAQVTVVFGLPIGGVLSSAFGWRALFLVNLPLAIVTFVFAYLGVARDDVPEQRSARGMLDALDLAGILLFAATTAALLTFLADLASPQWWILALALALLAALIAWEFRAREPLIDVRALAANAPLGRTYLRQLLVALGVYAALYGASQWMEQAGGLTPLAVGLVLLPLSGLSIVISRLSSNRGWVRWPLIIAAVALVLTGALMMGITHDSAELIPLLIVMSLLFGVTNGFAGFANQAALYLQAPGSGIAVASGLYRTFSYLGAIFSSSLISIVFGTTITDAGFHRLAVAIAGIGVLLALLTALDRRIPRVAS